MTELHVCRANGPPLNECIEFDHYQANLKPPQMKNKPHIIHVNRQHISLNAKDGGERPVYTIKMNDGRIRYAREVNIMGPSRMVYDGSQLKCGARAWIETYSDLDLVDEMSFQEARKSM